MTGDDSGKLYLSYSDYDEQGNSTAHIFVSEDNGATGRELEGDVRSALGNLTSLGVLSDGSIAAMDFYGGAAVLLDAEGNLLEQLDFFGFLRVQLRCAGCLHRHRCAGQSGNPPDEPRGRQP